VQAIVLAAGSGRRLAPMGWDSPKCLLPVGGRTLLNALMDAVAAVGVSHLAVVVGYRKELIEQALGDCPVPADIIVNRDYADTNTIHSLWLAREHLGDGFLYFNADVLFDHRILALLLAERVSALAVDPRACGDEEVKVIAGRDRRISRIGKALPPGDCFGEFVGIGRFQASACGALLEALQKYNELRRERRLFFESAVDDILARHEFLAVPIGDYASVEIDAPEDYHRAQALWRGGRVQLAPRSRPPG